MREPAAFYVRSRDRLDVIADDPDCHLLALPGAPTAPRMVSVHFLDCAKDGLDDAALVVLVHEPGQLVPVRSGHIAPGLATTVLTDGVGFEPDARYRALVGYGVADLPCRIGRVQAEEVGPSSILPDIGHILAMSDVDPSATGQSRVTLTNNFAS